MFKIVITKERGQSLVSAVPSSWENENILFWPPLLKQKAIDELRKNEKSIPAKSWKKLKCIVKVSDIKTLKEALDLEELYGNTYSTDEEGFVFKIYFQKFLTNY